MKADTHNPMEQIPRDPAVDIRWMAESLDTLRAVIPRKCNDEYDKFRRQAVELISDLVARNKQQETEIQQFKDISKLLLKQCETYIEIITQESGE